MVVVRRHDARAGRGRRGVPSSCMPHRRIPRPPGTPKESGDPLASTGDALRWGVVSTGSIASEVTAQIARLGDATLQAVSSRDADRARAFAERFGFATSYGGGATPSFERLAADPDVDVVYVATPHGSHFDVTKAVLEAGKHALVEKSFTVTGAEAEALVDIARERGLFLMEAVWTRFVPAFHAALDEVEAGALGDVRWIQGDLGFRATSDARRRLWAPEDGGGALLDLSVYPLTWVLGVLGFPDRLEAEAELTDEGVDAANALTLSWAHGARAQLLSTLLAQTTRTLTIGGTEGTLRTGAPLTGPDAFVIERDGSVHESHFEPSAPRYAYQLREVTRCIQGGLRESPTMPLDDTIATMRLFDEARRRMGVTYPHDAREF